MGLTPCADPASFPVVLGDFGCDVTRQACRENSPRTASRYRARFQASSGHSDSANRPGYEAGADRNSLAQVFSADAVFQSHECSIKAWEKTGVLAAYCLLADLRGLLVNLFVKFSPFFFLQKYPESFQCNLERPKSFSFQSFTALLFPNAKCKELEKQRARSVRVVRGQRRSIFSIFQLLASSR